MKNTIQDFKNYWNRNYCHIYYEFSDSEIDDFMTSCKTVERACDLASDYVLSQGLGEVVP